MAPIHNNQQLKQSLRQVQDNPPEVSDLTGQANSIQPLLKTRASIRGPILNNTLNQALRKSIALENLTFQAPTSDEAPALARFAMHSNDLYQTRTCSDETVLEVFKIEPEQINNGLVEKLVTEQQSETLGLYALKTPDLTQVQQTEQNPQEDIELSHLFVRADSINGGLGTHLFNRAADKARALGAKKMHWISDPDAADFYKKLGAIQTGKDQNILNPRVPVPLFSYSIADMKKEHPPIQRSVDHLNAA